MQSKAQMEKQMTDFKLPDRLIVRWAKAILGAILAVIVILLFDYAFGGAEMNRYWIIFVVFLFGSLHGSRGKWI